MDNEQHIYSFLNSWNWQRYMEDSIERLHCCQVREVELEGERFWMTVPSEPILYGMAKASEAGLFSPEYGELDGGHLAYRFWDDYAGYIPVGRRKGRNTCIKYVYRLKGKSWNLNGYDPEDRYTSTPAVLGEDRLMQGIHYPFQADTDGEGRQRDFRPMLVPLNQAGDWDRSFSGSVPDGTITTGGWLALEYIGPDAEYGTYIYGAKTPGLDTVMIDKPFVPKDSTLLDYKLISENGRGQPLRWRSYGGVLVCTRKFRGMTLDDLYQLNLVPQVGSAGF